MDNTLPIMLEYTIQSAWVMQETTLARLVEIVERHYAGERLTAGQVQQLQNSRKRNEGSETAFEYHADTRTAIIPISGVIAKHARMVNGVSTPRGTSVEYVHGQIQAARDDPEVDRILLVIESPGGAVSGVADLGDMIYQVGFDKPVVAFADDMASSAAYWLGSQANKFYANQTAVVGSIGVYSLVVDSSARAKELGLKIHIVRTGKNKGVGAPGVAISKENLAALQNTADSAYKIFLDAILRGRAGSGLDAKSLQGLADGREFIGAEAVENKLIDGIRTYRAVLADTSIRVRVKKYSGMSTVATKPTSNIGSTVMTSNQMSNVVNEPAAVKPGQTYVTTVRRLTQNGFSKAAAYREAAIIMPDDHRAWVDNGCVPTV